MNEALQSLAELLRERDLIDAKIARCTGRSARPGDVGEFVASQIFDIDLAANPVQAGHDGRFGSGELAGRSVNIKIYGDAAGGIDISPHSCDYYLILSGSAKPTGPVAHHRWRLSSVYLFAAQRLMAQLVERNVKIGIATSWRKADLTAAQIYPTAGPDALLGLTDEQRSALSIFE